MMPTMYCNISAQWYLLWAPLYPPRVPSRRCLGLLPLGMSRVILGGPVGAVVEVGYVGIADLLRFLFERSLACLIFHYQVRSLDLGDLFLG